MGLYKNLARKSLQQWAKIGRAPGILHQLVDTHAASLAGTNLVRSVYKNNKMICDLSDHVQSRVYFFGAYEPIEAHLFLNLIEPGYHVVDAGANIGFYSLLSATQVGDQGCVYSFEPVPSNYNQLLKNIELSGQKNIKVHKQGLWNKVETLPFSLDQSMDDNQGSFTAGPVDQAHSQVNCEVTPLDNLIADGRIKKVDLVKMDIEGAELLAIQGAKKVIEEFKPSFLMEINQEACRRMGYPSSEIDQIFISQGYKIFLVNTLPKESGYIDSTEKISQSNVFYISPKDINRFKNTWDPRKVRKLFANC